jgi:hypothetical protein
VAPADPVLGWELSDPITDPTRIDTDADMLTDGFELTPYQNELRPPNPPGTRTPLQATSAERGDSDGDGVSDGLERSLGGNPRVSDLVNLQDTDRDGLVDALEASPYEITTRRAHGRTFVLEDVCRNSTCPAQPVSVLPGGATSNPGVADTDDDGLGDAEERELGLDAGNDDTDADGLTDFDEVRGFELRDLGVVRTNPLNEDTDNDKRTDGEEAGRVGAPWVVTVLLPETPPREAFSNPLRSDTDLDRLLDGDEQAFFADPTNHNTDGDRRYDFVEVEDGTRTYLPDVDVRLFFGSVSIAKTGDGGDTDAAEISWLFIPDRGPNNTMIGNGAAPVGGQVPLGDGWWELGSISTSELVWEEFFVNGDVRELDGGATDCRANFPGFGLPDGDLPGIMAGRDLVVGTTPWRLHRHVVCTSGNEFDITVNLAIRAF